VHSQQDVIKWPHAEIAKVENSLRSCSNLDAWNIPKLKDHSFETSLLAFKEKLILWEIVLEGRDSFMPPLEVARRSVYLGAEFAKYTKDCIEDSLRLRSTKGTQDTYDLGDPDAWGFDYFFSPRNLLNFEIIDDKEDIMRLLEEPPMIKPKYLKLIEEGFRQFIEVPSHRVDLDDLDKLGMFTQTSVFVPEKRTRTRRSRNYEARLGKSFGKSAPMQFQYCFVQKNPSEGRAAVVGTAETIENIKRFHKMFKAVSNCPEDKYYDPSFMTGLEGWLTSYNNSTGYLMSDIKKSGLTFNRHLFNLLIKVLHEKMPTWGWDFFKDYGGATIDLNNGSKPELIKNGFGLGMMDCVISFTQAVIYNVLLEKEDLNMYHLDAMFWSDDSVIRARMKSGTELDIDPLNDLMDKFNCIASECGIVIHEKKPFATTQGVFLETYGRNFPRWDTQKRGQYIGCLFETLKAPDIFRAKEVFATLVADVPESMARYVSLALSSIIDYWGYEFSPLEAHMPFECGGWMYFIEDGFNTLFYDAQESEDSEYCKLVKLCMVAKPPRRVLKLHKEHEDYIEQLIDMGWHDDPTALSWTMLAGSSLKQDYKASQDMVSEELKILKKRQEFYRHADKTSYTELGALHLFWDRSKKTGFYLPPPFALERLEGSHVASDFVAEKPRIRFSKERAWLYLTKQRGATVDVIDPHTAYTSYASVAGTLLRALSGSRHVTIHQCAFALENGYDLERLSISLWKKLGHLYVIKRDQDPCAETIKLLTESMTPFRGDTVFPLPGTPYSILTEYCQGCSVTRFDGVTEVGAALALAWEPLKNEMGIYPTSTFNFCEDMENIFKETFSNSSFKRRVTEDPEISEEFDDDQVRENLAYFSQMIAGVWAHLSVNFGSHDETLERGVTIDEEYTSAFDMDDFEMGEMFG
jgi:hypothetical protein